MPDSTTPERPRSEAGGSWSTIGARAGQLVDWCGVDKATLLALVPAPFLVVAWARLSFLLGHPEAEPYVRRSVVASLRLLISGYFLVLPVLFGLWWKLRRSAPEHRGFVGLTLVAWFVATGFGAHLVGPFSSPVLTAYLAGAMSALVLFDIRLASGAIALGALAIFAPVPMIAIGAANYGPLYASPPFVGGRPTIDWLLLTSIFSAAIVSVPIVLLASVLSRWRRRDAEIHHMARFDVLTSLANRRYFLEQLEQEMERARRYGTKLGFLLIDLDHFKAVNDTHGHLVGDRVLAHVSRLLVERALRRVDVTGRYGGEELAVFLPSTDLDGALIAAERCRALIEATPLPRGDLPALAITASLGCASFDPERDASVDDLVRRADAALYAAKQAGRNRVDVAA